jgi:hypothetical protein
MTKVDLVVVGSGVTGLTTALNARKNGLVVLILESATRSGGQIFSVNLKENNNVSLDLGAEFIDIRSHYSVIGEINKRRLMMNKMDFSSNFCSFADKSTSKMIDLAQIINNKMYINALRIINDHCQRLTFSTGYDQRDFSYLDVSVSDYIMSSLDLVIDASDNAVHTTIAYKVRELILIQIFMLTGSDPSLQSTLGLLHTIKGFGSVENAFAIIGGVDNRPTDKNRTPSGMYRVDGGLGRLVASMATEFEEMGGVIRYNSPVICVTAIDSSQPDTNNTPNYDYPQVSCPRRDVLLKLASGETLVSRAVVVAIPLSCVPSIVFTPPLPTCIRLAGERCNTGQQYVKVFGRASGVSSRVDHVLAYSLAAKDVQTLAASSIEGDIAVTTRTAVFSYREDEDLVDDGEEGEPTSVVRLAGWRRDLLCGADIGKVLKQSHPAAEFVSSTRTSHGSSEISLTHHHDFPSDCWSRGSWFSLRAGTAELHVEAGRAARSPWGGIETETTDNRRRESVDRVLDGSECGPLILACSDLHPEWTGWVEGGLRAGAEAALRIAPYLNPPKTARNFFKRVYPTDATGNRQRK